MLRSEAMIIAQTLVPKGFQFNSLDLGTGADGYGEWRATFTNDKNPPEFVIERWPDVYTENDPMPEEAEDENGESNADSEHDTERVSNASEPSE